LSWQSHEGLCHCKIHQKSYRKKRRLGSNLTPGGRLRVKPSVSDWRHSLVPTNDISQASAHCEYALQLHWFVYFFQFNARLSQIRDTLNGNRRPALFRIVFFNYGHFALHWHAAASVMKLLAMFAEAERLCE
jgi:hypothetical protein